jgi:hypothetical protein
MFGSDYTQYPQVTLNNCQYQSGVYQANQRNEQSALRGHENARGLKADNGYSLQGSLGEIAAHVRFHLPFEYSINKWQYADLDFSGLPVDVKTQSRADTLHIPPRHLHDDWYYWLIVQVTQTRFAFIGWIKGDQVKQFPLIDIGNRGSSVYCVPRSALNKFKPILN